MKRSPFAACGVASLSAVAVLLGAPVALWAQTVIPPNLADIRPHSAAEVRARIDQALAAPALKNAVIGILVRSAEDGRTLYERNADLSLVPASNLKLLTAATALAKLGTDFRYKTDLLHTGTIDKNGTLKGDLYLRGSGDPSLTSDRLMQFGDELRKAGVKQINGKFVGDASAFDDNVLGEGWAWDDEPYDYAAQVAGLNCDENTIAVMVTPSETDGAPALIQIGGRRWNSQGFEGSTYVTVASTVTTSAAAGAGAAVKPAIAATRDRAANILRLSGTIPRMASPVEERLTVEDPALFTTTRLTEVLPTFGVKIPAVKDRHIETGKTPPEAVAFSTSTSDPLNDLVKHFLKESDNLYGEALLKTVGGGTTAGGVAAVRQFLQSAGVSADGLNMVDGSGLSRKDSVTPRLLVNLLIAAGRGLDAARSGALESALPVGGVDGTLKGRFVNTPAEGRVEAKTGSMDGISALSGYLRAATGERLVFSILMNDYIDGQTAAARAAQDAVVLALMDAPRDMGRAGAAPAATPAPAAGGRARRPGSGAHR